MALNFTARDLSESRFSEALPLVRATWPAVDLGTWQEFARSFAGDAQRPGSNIVALFDAANALCGMFAYRVEQDLIEGRILSVAVFTAVDVANSLDPIRALLGAAEARAQGSGCAAIHIRLFSEQRELSKRLRVLAPMRVEILHGMKLGDALRN